jgi:hypothetical protein
MDYQNDEWQRKGTTLSDKTAPQTLSAAEKAVVLDELLAARPDLREPAEA